MMDDLFIKKHAEEQRLYEQDILSVERKFNIHFPEKLRNLYLEYNGCYCRELLMQIEDSEYDIRLIFPLTGQHVTLSFMEECVRRNRRIPSSWYPFGMDYGEGIYLWDSLTGEIWYIAENSELEPEFMFESIDEMFSAMNTSICAGKYVRKKRRNEPVILPLGSIVLLKNGTRKLMIIGRGQMKEMEGRMYYFDYSAAVYPEGVTGAEFVYFDQSNIRSILFFGYRDDSNTVIADRLREYLRNHPEINRYPFREEL